MSSRVFLVCHPNFTAVQSTCQNVKHLIWGLCRFRWGTECTVTSPLTAEWLFQSRPVCNQWQKVTHTPPTRTLTADWYTTHSHIHMHQDRPMYAPHIHSNAKQIQNTHAKTDTHSWINTLGHNPRDEPYGTSIGSSITQSQKMAGLLRVCVIVSLLCVLHVSSYLKVMNTFPRSTICMAWSHWNCVSFWCPCVCMMVCMCVCAQIYSHWLQEAAVCVHVSPCVRGLFAHI